jgi:hypothetical protein
VLSDAEHSAFVRQQRRRCLSASCRCKFGILRLIAIGAYNRGDFMLLRHGHKSSLPREHNPVCVDRQPQQTIRAGFAAALISGSDQISEPQHVSCATI